MNELFRIFAHRVSKLAGNAWTFLFALTFIIVWLLTGPMFAYTNRWQLAVNTGTTIITFLMVFIIQNTQNRDAKAMHLKIDELLRAVKGARLGMMDAEDLPDLELEKVFEELRKINHHYKTKKQQKLIDN